MPIESGLQGTLVSVGKDFVIMGADRIEVSPDGKVTAYTTDGVETKPASGASTSGISISADFNTVVLNGATIERAADGHLVISSPGTVITKPGLVNDSVAISAKPQIGDVMPAVHKQAGWIYMGPDDETGEIFYAAPKDESGTFTFNKAAKRAESIGAKVPSQSQLDKMYRNKDKGALKDTFNVTGSDSAGWYWSSRDDYYNGFAWAQRFSDGLQGYNGKYDDSSLRCVR
jgi:hypothetical protein